MTVCVENLVKRIGKSTVLDDVSMEVRSGSVVGLSGVNGSGKTMLMRAMAALIRPTGGSIVVDGKRLFRDIPFPPSVGLLIENPAFLDSRTGRENLLLLASIKQGGKGGPGRRALADSVDESLRLVGLYPEDSRRFRKYSLGMKQRLGIAAAVMEHPSLLLLDEPANALDASGVEMLKKVVMAEKQRGAAIVLACHDADLLDELADEVYFLSDGRVVGHTEKEVARSA